MNIEMSAAFSAAAANAGPASPTNHPNVKSASVTVIARLPLNRFGIFNFPPWMNERRARYGRTRLAGWGFPPSGLPLSSPLLSSPDQTHRDPGLSGPPTSNNEGGQERLLAQLGTS